jgi:hypothetical protein
MKVLRNNNVIIKKVTPNSNLLTKIKSSSILYEKIDEKIYLEEYKDNSKYKKTDEYDDAYSSNMLKNYKDTNYKYHELIDRLDDTNIFCDVILPIFIFVCTINAFIIILYILYLEIFS